jgi:hypothetical protein
MRIDIGKYTAEAPAKARALYKKLGRNAKKFAREDLHWKVLLAPRKHRERRPCTASVTLSDSCSATRPLPRISHRIVRRTIIKAQHAKAAAAIKQHNLAAAVVPTKPDP